MAATTIHLGFEVGTGAPVAVPLKHMAVTGQTQEAGKTTALEALIERSGLRAIAFITKRGEGAFGAAHQTPPYFRERADWVYVASLIDATLGEKNKLLRAWLMKVCRNTTTLAEVHANVREAKATARGFSESIYTEIDGYLELVVPQLAELPPATAIRLQPGLNVMDLSPYSAALQGLVIRSAMDWVYENEEGVVTIIPEAWEFLPEGRGSPVKPAAEALIRKGASLRNYVWIDSQDMAGVWKLALRAAAVWLIGVQRESNEIKRTLENIPAGIARPSRADIAALDLGQFYACWGKKVVKTYVQPAWLGEAEARAVALGQRPPFERPAAAAPASSAAPEDMEMDKETLATLHQLTRAVQALNQRLDALPAPQQRAATPAAPSASAAPGDDEALYQRFKSRLLADVPALFQIIEEQPELIVTVTRPVFEVDGKTLRGRLLLLIADGFFDSATTGNAAFVELKRLAFKTAKPNVYRELDKLAGEGALTKEADGYLKVAGLKITRRNG